MEVDQSILDAVYTENYFKGEEYLDYLEDQEVQRINFADRIKTFNKTVGRDPERILEIGCAYGLFGDVARKLWPKSKYLGYDVVEEAIDHASQVLKLDARKEDYLAASVSDKSDAVFMWDVIEHLQYPEKFIEKIAQETLAGSHLCITTGDIEAALPRFQGQKWRMIHPPSHLHYFSKNTLTQLLEKNGFEVVGYSYPSIKRSVRLISFGLFALNKPKTHFFNLLHNKIPSRWAMRINTFDIMFVIARKKDGP